MRFNQSSDAPVPAVEESREYPGIFAAVERQLGLKLNKTEDVEMDVVLVDSVEKVPSGN
jgi:uncharacterized protein (TIGR03435 family)